MRDGNPVDAVNFRTLTIVSVLAGFLLIPFHEFGHVLGYWFAGHRAAMSYARAWLIPDGPEPFLGVLGGPLVPIILSAVSVFLIYRKWNLSVLYPLGILGSFERLVHYLTGRLPGDEATLANMMGWKIHTFKFMFLSAGILLLLLIAASFYQNRIKFKQAALIVLIPIVCFCVLSGFGLFAIEQFIFPEQFKIQFGCIFLQACPNQLFSTISFWTESQKGKPGKCGNKEELQSGGAAEPRNPGTENLQV